MSPISSGPYTALSPLLSCQCQLTNGQMIVPSPVVTIAALLRIFEAKGCDVYFRAASHAESVDEVVRVAKATITSSTVPELGDLFQDTSVVDPDAFKYTEHPDLAMNDPWLVFHTSGTTGTK